MHQEHPSTSEISMNCGKGIFAPQEVDASHAVVSVTLECFNFASAIEMPINRGTMISVSHQIMSSHMAISAILVHRRNAGASEMLDLSRR